MGVAAGMGEPGKPRRPLWRRVLRWFLWLLGVGFALVVVLVVTAVWLWKSGRFIAFMSRKEAAKAELVAPSERPWPPTNAPAGVLPPDTWPGPRRSLAGVGSPGAFYGTTQVWEVRLTFSAKEWDAIQPTTHAPGFKFGPMPEKFPLRNPEAPRNGLAGVVGFGQPWSKARVEVGGVEFADVAVRLKGNGTFLGSLAAYKKPYKVDFTRGHPERRVAGFGVLNLNNLNADFAGVSDALGYGLYRAAGVPAPRTAYARLLLTIGGKFERRPLGLYSLVENLDEGWVREAFGGRPVALFKPVTYELFSDLGTNWAAYDGIYDPKGKITEAAQRRVMETARFVTSATDADFARRAGEYFDLVEVARFVAVTSLISNYDGFLLNGQNFFMYLDMESGRFGFIPWDLDRAFGEFAIVGTRRQRETASLFRPWVADHRLLERLFLVDEFRLLHREELTRLARAHFRPEGLRAEVRRLAAMIRPTVLEESDYRIGRFEESHAETWPEAEEPEPLLNDPFRPVNRIHRFLIRRAESVDAQLAGRAEGHVFLRRPDPTGAGGGE